MTGRRFEGIRPIAIAVVLAFGAEQVALAAPAMPSIIPPAVLTPALNFRLPESVAVVSDAYQAPGSSKLLILIQDAHTNDSGQMNVAKALTAILPKEKITTVFTEADSGDVSLNYMKPFFTQKVREEVGRSLVRKGILRGHDYANLIGQDFTLWGVEDPALYKQTLETYKELMLKRDKVRAYVDRVQRAADAVKGDIFSDEVRELDAKRVLNVKGELSLADYAELLLNKAGKAGVSTAKYPHIKFLRRLRAIEKRVDFNRASSEEREALQTLPEADRNELLAAHKISPQATTEENGFYTLFEEKLIASSNPIAPRKHFPSLFKYFAYLKETRKMNALGVVDEVRGIEEELFLTLTKTQNEAILWVFSRNLETLQNLIALKVSPEEFDRIKTEAALYDIKLIAGFLNAQIAAAGKHYENALTLDEAYAAAWKDATDFYDLTLKRDRVFFDRVNTKMTEDKLDKAVLITGGYHTPNLKQMLKSAGISYVSLLPQVLAETDTNRYEKLLLAQLDDKSASNNTRLAGTRKAVKDAAMTQQASGSRLAIALGATQDQATQLVARSTALGTTSAARMAKKNPVEVVKHAKELLGQARTAFNQVRMEGFLSGDSIFSRDKAYILGKLKDADLSIQGALTALDESGSVPAKDIKAVVELLKNLLDSSELTNVTNDCSDGSISLLASFGKNLQAVITDIDSLSIVGAKTDSPRIWGRAKHGARMAEVTSYYYVNIDRVRWPKPGESVRFKISADGDEDSIDLKSFGIDEPRAKNDGNGFSRLIRVTVYTSGSGHYVKELIVKGTNGSDLVVPVRHKAIKVTNTPGQGNTVPLLKFVYRAKIKINQEPVRARIEKGSEFYYVKTERIRWPKRGSELKLAITHDGDGIIPLKSFGIAAPGIIESANGYVKLINVIIYKYRGNYYVKKLAVQDKNGTHTLSVEPQTVKVTPVKKSPGDNTFPLVQLEYQGSTVARMVAPAPTIAEAWRRDLKQVELFDGFFSSNLIASDDQILRATPGFEVHFKIVRDEALVKYRLVLEPIAIRDLGLCIQSISIPADDGYIQIPDTDKPTNIDLQVTDGDGNFRGNIRISVMGAGITEQEDGKVKANTQLKITWHRGAITEEQIPVPTTFAEAMRSGLSQVPLYKGRVEVSDGERTIMLMQGGPQFKIVTRQDPESRAWSLHAKPIEMGGHYVQLLSPVAADDGFIKINDPTNIDFMVSNSSDGLQGYIRVTVIHSGLTIGPDKELVSAYPQLEITWHRNPPAGARMALPRGLAAKLMSVLKKFEDMDSGKFAAQSERALEDARTSFWLGTSNRELAENLRLLADTAQAGLTGVFNNEFSGIVITPDNIVYLVGSGFNLSGDSSAVFYHPVLYRDRQHTNGGIAELFGADKASTRFAGAQFIPLSRLQEIADTERAENARLLEITKPFIAAAGRLYSHTKVYGDEHRHVDVYRTSARTEPYLDEFWIYVHDTAAELAGDTFPRLTIKITPTTGEASVELGDPGLVDLLQQITPRIKAFTLSRLIEKATGIKPTALAEDVPQAVLDEHKAALALFVAKFLELNPGSKEIIPYMMGDYLVVFTAKDMGSQLELLDALASDASVPVVLTKGARMAAPSDAEAQGEMARGLSVLRTHMELASNERAGQMPNLIGYYELAAQVDVDALKKHPYLLDVFVAQYAAELAAKMKTRPMDRQVLLTSGVDGDIAERIKTKLQSLYKHLNAVVLLPGESTEDHSIITDVDSPTVLEQALAEHGIQPADYLGYQVGASDNPAKLTLATFKVGVKKTEFTGSAQAVNSSIQSKNMVLDLLLHLKITYKGKSPKEIADKIWEIYNDKSAADAFVGDNDFTRINAQYFGKNGFGNAQLMIDALLTAQHNLAIRPFTVANALAFMRMVIAQVAIAA